jgi:hypothetical protein
MGINSFNLCPHFRASDNGAICNVLNKYIKDMYAYNIKMCMGSHHEACDVYKSYLLKNLYNSDQHVDTAL